MDFKYITPAQAGVPAEGICGFFETLDKTPIDMHSVIMLRGGKILLEVYYEPYKPYSLHRMYSVTKSFVSLAIGALAAEGRISLDDKIVKYFPEFPTPYKWIAQTTIRNMLMMRSPHDYTTYKQHPEMPWVESFFKTEPTHEPGTVFAYDTSATHTLGALVEKLTGKQLLDYLRDVCLDEIGFSKDAYCLKDEQGVSIGGSGMMARPMDLARVAALVMNGGRYNGKQLLDEEYLKAATSYQSRTETRGSFPDERQGYGMQFWRTRNNSYMMYGMAGQLALCVPDKDFILITTADTLSCHDGLQDILDAFWSNIYSRLDTVMTDKQAELDEILKNRRILPTVGEGKPFRGEYEFGKNKMGLKRIGITTTRDGGELRYTNETGSHILLFKTGDFEYELFPYYDCQCITSGAWVEDNRLVIKSRLTGEMVGSVNMELYFNSGAVTISSRKTEGHYFGEFNGVASGRSIK
ncbi:MAG: serine hydrolase domain-containing protein [Candidatus Ornithomonoglobus sp.]